MCDEFHPTLKKDFLWELYASTLYSVPIFHGLDLTFFQQLCAEIRTVYYLENNTIVSVNDVTNWVYIISRGAVQVSSAAGSPLVVLTKGS